jgi:hypothetical protein
MELIPTGSEVDGRWPCTRRDSDQRVHRNPVTLVTPTVRDLALNLSHEQQRAMSSEWNRESVRAQDADVGRKRTNDERPAKEGERSDDDAHDWNT